MPKDYSKGVIYGIRSPHTNDVYIGSTIQLLYVRMAGHRRDAKKDNKCSSRTIIEAGDAYIELIEEFPCENLQQLRKREGEIIRSTPNCINFKIAGRGHKEYYQDTKEEQAIKNRKYREEHKEEIAKKDKERKERDKEKVKARCKAYRERTKEARAKYNREYNAKKKAM